MGDHRATIKVEFEMHGHKAKQDFWINWSPADNGVDDRVTDWIAVHAQKAMDAYWEQEYGAQTVRDAERENHERSQLAALKAKYEP